MKKLGWTTIGVALGVVMTVSFVSRAQAQDGKVTLYGDAPKNARNGSNWSFSFKDPKTSKAIATRQAQVTVKDGRYMAEVDRSGLEPGKVYSIDVAAEGGEPLAMVTFVTLQASTPGVAESGNINVSGTILATTKIGVGTGSMPYMLNARTTSSTGGVFGQSNGNGMRGVSQATSGSFAGGSFNGSSPAGYGVFGINSGTTGTAYGGYFKTSSATGTGLHGDTPFTGDFGEMTGVKGTAHCANMFQDFSTGVYGETINTGGTIAYGVLGQNNPVAFGFAVFGNGDLGCSGTKTFQIDDPADPENKWLRHYCTESSEPLLEYSGIATLDSGGGATVSLPSYWSSVNKDPRYQLTPVGASMPNLYVAGEVQNNQFRIAGGKAGMKVSWKITGTRNDPWVRRSGIQTVIEKPASARGKYYDPALYGQPESKALIPYAAPTKAAADPQ
jgi:hypothetical protein